MSQSGGWMPDGTEEDPSFESDPDGENRDAGREQTARLKKSPNAFRTISEVADDLHIPQHVLRFWETRFPQVKPLKRGGGRRYYRPDDIALLRRISGLLYIQGYTIKGVQRLLREGDGTLSGDLPPPDAADHGDDPEILPDLEIEAAEVDGAATAMHDLPMDQEHAPPEPLADTEALEDEVRHLRDTLETVLGELQSMRRRLAL